MRVRSWSAWLFALLLVDSVATAAIRVEADGSGDFTELQQGLDAAAEGDTVLVGPGRYDRFSVHDVADGSHAYSVGFIAKSRITLLGTDREAVVVTIPQLDIIGPAAASLVIDVGAEGVEIGNLTVKSTGGLLADYQGGWVHDVTFVSWGSVAIRAPLANGLHLERCSFRGTFSSAIVWSGSPTRADAIVESCQFDSVNYPISVAATTDVLIRDCDFQGAKTAVQFSAGASGRIENCRFKQTSGSHVLVTSGAQLELVDNRFEAGAIHALESIDATTSGSGNRFGGGQWATLDIRGGSAEFHACEIYDGGRDAVLAVVQPETGDEFLDFRDNWWGTGVEARIRGSIADVSGDPSVELVPVVFVPFRGAAVATEALTVGGLKSRFRPR